jgi:hypothetical protein
MRGSWLQREPYNTIPEFVIAAMQYYGSRTERSSFLLITVPYFLKVHLHHFSKIKSHEGLTKQ